MVKNNKEKKLNQILICSKKKQYFYYSTHKKTHTNKKIIKNWKKELLKILQILQFKKTVV